MRGGKTSICEYLSTSRQYGDSNCIYIFEKSDGEKTKLCIYFVNCTSDKNSYQEKIDIESTDLQIEYECITESFEGGITGCDIDRDHSVNKTPTFVLGLVQGRHFVAL